MALDGTVIAAVVSELKKKLIGGRIVKISQPEKDELLFTIKNFDQYRLFMSADASLPLIYLTDIKKEAPVQAPAFCMLLRKHLTGAKILDIVQPDFERVIFIRLENLNEMGDLCEKTLVVEIMGKHSNIILCDAEMKIIDSIKRVPLNISSVREVLPGREYFITKTQNKYNPLKTSAGEFYALMKNACAPLSKALYMSYTGISPLLANETAFRAGLDPDLNSADLSEDIALHFFKCFMRIMESVTREEFNNNIVYKDAEPAEFSAVELSSFAGRETYSVRRFESISELLAVFYSSKNESVRIKQKSADLRKSLATVFERESRKYELQLEQLKSTEKRDKYKLYGELLTTYGYQLCGGDKETVVNNYYTGENITIPLDETLSGIENAKRYYDRYSKLKRTYEAVSKLIASTKEELEHLESVRLSLEMASMEEDLKAIREELWECGYIKSRGSDTKNRSSAKSGRRVSEPLHYVTEDDFHIYVGKNNYQNEELTFKFANGSDWWFHAKGIPGSHVILKTDGREVPDRVFEQAAALAAYYSKADRNEKTEVDYLERKNVKKPGGSKPGFVVYYTNYSMVAIPGTDGLSLV